MHFCQQAPKICSITATQIAYIPKEIGVADFPCNFACVVKRERIHDSH
jgi:hypothetical protein